jgi:AcrR family transcriptional regulator
VNETAEQLMCLAEAHIRDAGYGGFSFRDLAAELGIKSASVHHHFPTKATMAAAVARRYRDRILRPSRRDRAKVASRLSLSTDQPLERLSIEMVECV